VPEQVTREGTPSLPLERMVAALEIAIATALTTERDVREAGGATD
jgi:pyrrolidone-carboxylate peptidase